MNYYFPKQIPYIQKTNEIQESNNSGKFVFLFSCILSKSINLKFVFILLLFFFLHSVIKSQIIWRTKRTTFIKFLFPSLLSEMMCDIARRWGKHAHVLGILNVCVYYHSLVNNSISSSILREAIGKRAPPALGLQRPRKRKRPIFFEAANLDWSLSILQIKWNFKLLTDTEKYV